MQSQTSSSFKANPGGTEMGEIKSHAAGLPEMVAGKVAKQMKEALEKKNSEVIAECTKA